MKNAGDSLLLGMKDKNGYTAANHAGMGKTSRSVCTALKSIWLNTNTIVCITSLSVKK